MSGVGMEIKEKDKITLCISRGGGGSGDKNYNSLYNKPRIENNELIGDKTFIELGLGLITNQDIDDLFDEIIYGRN